MSVYSPSELKALRKSELVAAPPFDWNEFEQPAPQKAWQKEGKRAPVVPKAAIPFSQRALFDSGAKPDAEDADEVEGDADDDEFAARYLLKKEKPRVKKSQDADGQPVINLSYAAALAASMKMSEGATEETVEEVDEEGWTSVSQSKGRKNRNRSFSSWR